MQKKWDVTTAVKRRRKSGVYFTNILLAPFSYLSALCSFSLVTFWLWQKYEKYFHMKNGRVNCWWNWPQGLISPACLLTAFMHADPKSQKRQSSYQCFFALFGSGHVKAAHKMLIKLTPEIVLMSTILLIRITYLKKQDCKSRKEDRFCISSCCCCWKGNWLYHRTFMENNWV